MSQKNSIDNFSYIDELLASFACFHCMGCIIFVNTTSHQKSNVVENTSGTRKFKYSGFSRCHWPITFNLLPYSQRIVWPSLNTTHLKHILVNPISYGTSPYNESLVKWNLLPSCITYTTYAYPMHLSNLSSKLTNNLSSRL